MPSYPSSRTSPRGIPVAHDRRGLAGDLGLVAVDALTPQVHQEEVVIGTARNKIQTATPQGFAHSLRVLEHLLLIELVLGSLGHLQRHGESRDRLVVRTPLEAWEHRSIDLLFKVIHDRIALLVHTLLPLAEEDHGASRATQR